MTTTLFSSILSRLPDEKHFFFFPTTLNIGGQAGIGNFLFFSVFGESFWLGVQL